MYRIFDQTVLQRSLDQTDKDSRSRPILNCLDFLNSWEKLLVSNVDSFFENQFFIDTTPFLLRPPSLIIVDLQNVIILLNVLQCYWMYSRTNRIHAKGMFFGLSSGSYRWQGWLQLVPDPGIERRGLPLFWRSLQLGGLFVAGVCSDDHFTVYVHLCHLISVLWHVVIQYFSICCSLSLKKKI